MPADLYLEGSDQHRGWFQSSLLTSVAIRGKAPYKQVLTHGFTVDGNGEKMSKSKGNVVAPQQVMKTLGADILRLWVAATDYSKEMSVSDEIFKRTADSYRRIRNTARFMLANLAGFDPESDLLKVDDMLALDRWIVHHAKEVQQQIVEAYNSYQFHLIYQKLHNFCVVEMGGIYLDIIKDRQYTTQENSLARRSAQTALYHIVEAFSRWLAPVLSFTAEEIWRHIPGGKQDSVFLAEWYEGLFSLDDNSDMNSDFWRLMISIRSAVNKTMEEARSAGSIGSTLAAEITLFADETLFNQLAKLEEELRFFLIVSDVTLVNLDQSANAALTDIEGLKVLVVPSSHEKCERCWHYRADVGVDQEHSTLCSRCVENVYGKGEVRKYV